METTQQDTTVKEEERVFRPMAGQARSSKFRRYMNIVWELSLVDFRKKYHNSTLGYFWSMLNPLFRFLVYYFVFSFLFVVKTDKFTLWLLIGVFWYNFFQDTTWSIIGALDSKSRLAKKIYFPPYLIVIASTLTAFLSHAINSVMIFLTILIFDHASLYQLWVLVPFTLLLFLALGIALVVGTLYIHFRDISEIWGVVLALGFWLTPVMYDPTNVQEPLRTVALLNPVGRILTMARSFVLFENSPPWTFNVTTIAFCLGIFAVGLWLFRKYEHRVVEYL
ncbi:MAG TPA: ABC transporter permease [Bacteroidota bacterium]|nr:ABC transporter permease [Bacteroidota bacterium]